MLEHYLIYPAGLKARGLRIKGDNSPLMPGEFRDVDVPGGAIKDSITFLPYKEPSQVLYTLLNNVVEEGRRIGSVADIQVGDMNAQAPVGTTLALLERSMKVMSGVQARLHAAMKNELRILARIVHDYMPEEYSYEMDGEFNRIEDFDGRIDVIPVSDPERFYNGPTDYAVPSCAATSPTGTTVVRSWQAAPPDARGSWYPRRGRYHQTTGRY
jgi:hypothetical protein